MFINKKFGTHGKKRIQIKTLTSIHIWLAELYICTVKLYGLTEHARVQFSSEFFQVFAGLWKNIDG
jgi:hypothetical protein